MGQTDDSGLKWFYLLPEGELYFEQVNQQKFFDQCIIPSIAGTNQRVFPALLKEAGNLGTPKSHRFRQLLFDHDFTLNLFCGALKTVIIKTAQTQTTINQAVAACAIERNRLAGNPLPEKLEELAPHFLDIVPFDVIGGKPLRFKKTDDTHFLLYSVGWNEVDDGGTVATIPGSSANQDRSQGDWVWPAYPEKVE